MSGDPFLALSMGQSDAGSFFFGGGGEGEEVRQTQYEGGGGFAFEKVEGQQQILWVERMPRPR